MPLVDKPLSELVKYQGINPRPDDFDAYWDSSLEELEAIDPCVELVRNETLPLRNAECFDLTFTGIGGARVYAKYLRPARLEGKAPALVVFHGYHGSSGDWLSWLSYVSEGFCVAILDVRGQAGKSEDSIPVKGPTVRGQLIRGLDDPDPKKLFFRSVFLDTVRLSRIVMSFPEVDAERVGATGGSQGGALTLACAALEPRIKLAAAYYPFLSDYQRVWEMDQARDAYEELRSFFRQFDPMHKREKEIFTKLGYIDIQHLASRIKARTLMVVGLMDTICPPSTQYAAFNKITAPKETLIFPDFGHEIPPTAADQVFSFLLQLRD